MVGEDRSRTWIVSVLSDGRLRLKHDHRHEDGEPDAITMYGGDMEKEKGSEWDDGRFAFPADDVFKGDVRRTRHSGFQAEYLADRVESERGSFCLSNVATKPFLPD